MPTTPERIARILDRVEDLLLDRNARYGDSALHPIRIFSTADPLEQLRVRIDDKLSRIVRGHGLDEDDVLLDLVGYLVLLLVARDADAGENDDADEDDPADPPDVGDPPGGES